MTLNEGKELAVKALVSAMERDAYSGNGVSLAVIDKNGVKIYSNEEVEEMVEKIKSKRR